LQKKTKIILIVAVLLILGGLIYFEQYQSEHETYKLLGNTSIGTVEKLVYGNVDANKSITIITGIHPREKLAINPEIKAAKEFANSTDDVKVIHYQVNVTKNPKNYAKGRANGEKLVHDYVNPAVNTTDTSAVIISHSHIPEYGEGYYLATPAMDNASVKIAKKIKKHNDFNYYPRTGNETYKSNSAKLVSAPIANAGYPTFVYEIPEDITKSEATNKTVELFKMLDKYTS